MIFDPTDFETSTVRATNWLDLMLQGASSLRYRRRATSISHLSPRLLADIGYTQAHPDLPPRKLR
jgi:hypothetical protein